MKVILLLIIGVAVVGSVLLGTALGDIANKSFPVPVQSQQYSLQVSKSDGTWTSHDQVNVNMDDVKAYCIIDYSYSSRSGCDAIQIYQNDIIIKQNERIIELLESISNG